MQCTGMLAWFLDYFHVSKMPRIIGDSYLIDMVYSIQHKLGQLCHNEVEDWN